MNYTSLFSVQCRHDYFSIADDLSWSSTAIAPYIDWKPTKKSLRTLKNHRLLLRKLVAGVQVVASEKHTALLRNGLRLQFMLYLKDPIFLHFTEFVDAEKAVQGISIPVFSNGGLTEGEHRLKIKEASTTKEALNKEVWKQSPFALVDILTGDEREAHYVIHFATPEVRWQFYILSRENEHFLVEDQSIGPESNKIAFENSVIAPAEDVVASRLRKQHPEVELYLVRSREKIPCRAQVRENIRLRTDNRVLVQHLANPAPANRGISIIKLTG